jgi:hypothetical protein
MARNQSVHCFLARRWRGAVLPSPLGSPSLPSPRGPHQVSGPPAAALLALALLALLALHVLALFHPAAPNAAGLLAS